MRNGVLVYRRGVDVEELEMAFEEDCAGEGRSEK